MARRDDTSRDPNRPYPYVAAMRSLGVTNAQLETALAQSGTNAGIACYYNESIDLSERYSFLKEIMFIDSVMLRTPTILHPRSNKREGMFEEVHKNPAFTWLRDRKPNVNWERTVLYETHVKGFTKLHPAVPEKLRGTYAGLSTQAVVDYILKRWSLAASARP